MASLQEILQSAQGGKAAENLAARFGITPEQANAAIQALAPALSAGLQQAIRDPRNLGSIIGQLTAGLHQASYQSADSAHSDAGRAGGSSILNQIFGNPSVTTEIAQQASRITGLRPDLLVQMAPVIATMLAGGLVNSLKSQGFGSVLSQLGRGGATGVGDGSGGGAPISQGGLAGIFSALAGLFGAITGGRTAGSASTSEAALDALKRMLQPGSQVDPRHQAAISDILKR